MKTRHNVWSHSKKRSSMRQIRRRRLKLYKRRHNKIIHKKRRKGI